MAQTPSFATLSKCYAGAVATIAVILIGFMAAFTPDDEWSWEIAAYALGVYLGFAGYQFLFLVAFTALRRHFLLAAGGYIAAATTLNFAMFGMRDGIRSMLMFVIVAAVLCVAFLLSFGSRTANAR